MTIPDFLRFSPVPVRARKGGWTAAAQRRFILLLSQGAGPSEAARHLGRSKQGAYALRGKPAVCGFAAAWDAAVDFAATARAVKRGLAPVLAQSGLEVILTPRFYRGRLVGFVQRKDHSRVLETLKRLDTIAERAARSGGDRRITTVRSRSSSGCEAWKLTELTGLVVSALISSAFKPPRADNTGRRASLCRPSD